jgi:GNAT superfamily N-acetyltransferase
MIPRWRLTRNRYARAVYETLQRCGVTATRMYEYAAAVSAVPAPEAIDTAVTIETGLVEAFLQQGYDLDFSLPVDPYPDEYAAVAVADGQAVGRALVSAGETPYIAPLERPCSFPGGYVRRVFVAPAVRNQGVASALLRAVVATARTALGVDRVRALIAVDNRPSQWLFEGQRFTPVRVHEYARLGPFDTYRTRPVW